MNVLTCAAPNLRERPSNEMNAGDGDAAVHISREDLQALHEKRMRRVLEIAWRKALGDIRGVSYIYGMFYRFGLIDVPDKVKEKMNKCGCVAKS